MAGARGQWNSRFGFIMAAVGSAVGLGNLVRFPKEMAGQGGAAFLLVYLVLLILVGLPALLGEMSLGKLADMSPVNAFRKMAGSDKSKWAVLGVFGMMAAIFVLFFYTVIGGWALRFFFETFRDGWWDEPTALYGRAAYGPWAILWNLVVSAAMVYIVSRGVSGGIEKASVIMMPTLFAIIIGIVIFAAVKDGAAGFEGMKAVWTPKFSELEVNHISKATGQVFFSLSLGQGAMLTYASYMEKKQSIAKDGTTIAVADTGVAVLAAMMIFPILAFTGLLAQADANPTGEIAGAVSGSSFGTAFIAMPAAFVEMGAVVGRMVGSVFFLALFFAALSSAISLLEVPVAILGDNRGVPRWKAAILIGLVTYSFGVLSATNEHWLLLFDEVAINVFIVIGVALTTVFVGWRVPGVAKELDAGLKSRIGIYVVWMMRTATPLLIVFAFVFGGLWGVNPAGDFEFWFLTESGCEPDCGTSSNWAAMVRTFGQAMRFE